MVEVEKEKEKEKEKETVCVTGAGGYQASWLVKLLLSKGYMIHATVRDPNDEKNAHLKTLENASENLLLFKAELMDYDSLFAAIKGCTGVFHLATSILPDTVPNPEVEILEACVTGQSNVLKACSAANVKRVVVVSNIAAIVYDPSWPKGEPMDESCWSDEETCKTSKSWGGYNWYHLAKTVAETQALEYGKKTGLDVVTICPSLIMGPMLQPTMNVTSYLMYTLLKYGLETIENRVQMVVDVRDVAEALILLYEKAEAEGRYICAAHKITIKELSDKLKTMYPDYNYPKLFTEADGDQNLTSEKLQKLGWRYRSLEDTIANTVQNYRDRRILE